MESFQNHRPIGHMPSTFAVAAAAVAVVVVNFAEVAILEM